VRLSVGIVLTLGISLFSSAEEIQVKDGSKITGRITGVDGNLFRVKTAYGEIQVPRSEIIAIRFPENTPSQEGTSSGRPAGVEPVEESLDGTTYSNRTGHFQANVPLGWTIAPDLRKSSEIVAALKSADQALFFLVTPEQYSGSIKTYRVLAETQYQSKFKDYEKLSETDAKIDDRSSLRIVFKGKTSDTTLKFLVYIVPYSDRMVRLSFFTLEPLFEEAVPIFEKIGASYHSTSDKTVAGIDYREF
jgi:hypothetical protein